MQPIAEPLNAVSQIWADRMWAVLWQSTIVIIAVALMAAVALRHSSPAIRYWVWQILAIKLLLMPFWTYAVPAPWRLPAQSDQPTADLAQVEKRSIELPETRGPLEDGLARDVSRANDDAFVPAAAPVPT